ncbi:MAG: hypothetical protein HY446_01060 [Candidatus Niyogibacteria bacterium]|nr:hypothetical protein [Candidatus Niyogibacteria bacterium]
MSKGFTLLFSLLFVSATLAISLGVSDLLISQISLSGTGRDSQFAFYAADSAAECAIFWDRSEDKFSTSSPSTISCSGTDNIPVGGTPDGLSSFDLSYVNGSCANVEVDKSNPAETVITSIGSYPCSGGRKVERGLEVRY